MEIQELAGRISAEFRRRLTADKQAQRIIREGRDMADVSALANRLGRHLRAAVRHHTAGAELPFGTEEMEQLAREILDPLLRESCSLTDRVFSEVQHRLDSKRGISLGPVLREFPSSRAGQIYRSAADPTVTEETILRRLSVPPETLINSHCDRTMQSNAKVRSEAGFETYINRTDDGKCCPWCSKMAGRYEYPDKTPKDVFRRHDNCGCRVVWVCGNLRQDVHSKQTWEQTSVTEPELVRNPDVTVPELTKNPDVKVPELTSGLLTEEKNNDIIKLGINLFDKSDSIFLDAFSIEEEYGFKDIFIHGSPSSVQMKINGKLTNLSPTDFVKILKQNGYSGGNIRLASCSTGKGDNSFAQQLSELLGVKVKAPDDDVYFVPNEGIMFVGSEYMNTGKWRLFDKGVEIID